MATDSVTVSPTFNGDTVSLTVGMIVRLKPGANNNVVRAQADTAPHAQGVNGVVISGASAPTTGCVVASIGLETVQMESGLTPAVGDTVYVSPNVAGKGTNVLPGVVVPIGTIADVSNYARLGTVEVDVVCSASSAGGGGAFPGFGLAPPRNGAASTSGVLGTVARADHTHGADYADWGVPGSIRYFACDGTSGDDSRAGWSDVSQAAAGLVAVKTITQLLRIIPHFGAGRQARCAIRSGNYASDTILDMSQYSGYRKLVITATDTVPSAGAVAFQGDSNDTLCAGMTTATGMNVAGYNITAIANDGNGTITATLQLAGGGSPNFPAMPGRPYGCRIRGDIATTTPSLRNQCTSIIGVIGTNQVILTLQFGDGIGPVTPAPTDVFYIEMANVTGPTTTEINCSGGESNLANPVFGITGIALGRLEIGVSRVRFTCCEATGLLAFNASIFLNENTLAIDSTPSSPLIGYSLRLAGIWNQVGGSVTVIGFTGDNTGTYIWNCFSSIVCERSAFGSQVSMYGTPQAGGNNITWTFGSNYSTAHGSSVQVWGHNGTPPGTLACGLFLGGSAFVGRVKFSNMGANPCVRQCGVGLGVCLQGITGGVADGNLDVGVDFTPVGGVSGNTVAAFGSTCALVPNIGGPNSATGSNGDVRLSDGSIVSWAVAAAGVCDPNGNRIFAAGNAPDHPTPVANGAGVLNVTNAPAGATTYARYVKFPDGNGGFLTFGSLT